MIYIYITYMYYTFMYYLHISFYAFHISSVDFMYPMLIVLHVSTVNTRIFFREFYSYKTRLNP